jgi:hypothetical protein
MFWRVLRNRHRQKLRHHKQWQQDPKVRKVFREYRGFRDLLVFRVRKESKANAVPRETAVQPVFRVSKAFREPRDL